MALLRFGNDTVSGAGIRYNMNATNAPFVWDNFQEVEQQHGKAQGSPLDVRLPEGRYLGHAAPKITINGYIDTSRTPGTILYGTGTDGSVSVEINVGAMGSLALVGSGYLYYPMINTFIGKHPQGLSNANIELGGSVSAIIDTITLTPNLDYWIGSEYIIPYNMTLIIVSGPV